MQAMPGHADRRWKFFSIPSTEDIPIPVPRPSRSKSRQYRIVSATDVRAFLTVDTRSAKRAQVVMPKLASRCAPLFHQRDHLRLRHDATRTLDDSLFHATPYNAMRPRCGRVHGYGYPWRDHSIACQVSHSKSGLEDGWGCGWHKSFTDELLRPFVFIPRSCSNGCLPSCTFMHVYRSAPRPLPGLDYCESTTFEIASPGRPRRLVRTICLSLPSLCGLIACCSLYTPGASEVALQMVMVETYVKAQPSSRRF